jgi:hypothetical protein
MMNEEIPKVKKAAMLPNNFIMLDFDNGQRRYLPSHYMSQYENAFSGDAEVTKGTRRTIFIPPTLAFWGAEFEIRVDGTVILNEKDHYTREELWQDSVAHISSVRKNVPDATYWKRNIVIALILASPLIFITIAELLNL